MKTNYPLFLLVLIGTLSSCSTTYRKHTTRVKKSPNTHEVRKTAYIKQSEAPHIDNKANEHVDRPTFIDSKKSKSVLSSIDSKSEFFEIKKEHQVKIQPIDSPDLPPVPILSEAEHKAYRLNTQANVLTIISTISLLFFFLGIPILLAGFLTKRAIRIYESVHIPFSPQLYKLAKVVNWIAKFLVLLALTYIVLALLFLAIFW